MEYPGGIVAETVCSAAPDEMLTMLPPPWLLMGGATSLQSRKRLRTFVVIDSSHISTVISSNALRVGAMALLTRTSTRAKCAVVEATRDARAAEFGASHRTARGRPPSSSLVRAVEWG